MLKGAPGNRCWVIDKNVGHLSRILRPRHLHQSSAGRTVVERDVRQALIAGGPICSTRYLGDFDRLGRRENRAPLATLGQTLVPWRI